MFAEPSLDYRCGNISKTNNLRILQVLEKMPQIQDTIFFQVSSVKDIFIFPKILNSQVMSVQFPSSSDQIWYFWHVFFMFHDMLPSYHCLPTTPVWFRSRSPGVPCLCPTLNQLADPPNLLHPQARLISNCDKHDFQTLGKLLGPTFCPSKPLKRDGSCILDCIYIYKYYIDWALSKHWITIHSEG